VYSLDVKYIPTDWEKMRDGIGDLIGLGRWGKGMMDDLKDLSDNLEDAESDIAKYDSDGVISFHHTSQKSKYQGLYEDFEVLHSFTGKVGDIVDRRIDHPFYEEIDAFVETMRDATISKYTTKNRIGATETKIVYAGYGQQQSLKVPKTEVSIDDLFTGDNFYANQMKLQYDEWTKLNPDQDFTQKEYQQAVLNSHAFQYESIKDQQENKEFWGQIAALVVIVGVSLVCPPAGMALGVAYGSLELSSAVSGKDWISGRKLGTGERWFRGVLSPLDIVPGVSGLSKFSSAVRVAHLGEDLGALGLRTGVKASFHQGVIQINNMVKTTGRESVSRLKSAAAKVKDVPVVVKNKVVEDVVDVGRMVRSVRSRIVVHPKASLYAPGVGNVRLVDTAEEVTSVGSKVSDNISNIEVGTVGGKGTGENNIQGARYGERKISDEIYGKLRRASPSSKIQREVNKNIDDIIGTEDFALPGKIIDKKLHADHIVSLEKIARMEGFETLTYNQQKEIANFVENFIGLSEAANTSKGSKSFADWYIYKKENIPVNPVFREKMILKEKELEIEIQKIIDEFNRINKKE